MAFGVTKLVKRRIYGQEKNDGNKRPYKHIYTLNLTSGTGGAVVTGLTDIFNIQLNINTDELRHTTLSGGTVTVVVASGPTVGWMTVEGYK